MPPDSKFGLVLIATVVDDFLIVTKNRAIMAQVKAMLRKHWTISDKGPVKWMLNVRIRRDRPSGVMKIDQSAYIERKLREFGLDKLPGKAVPMQSTTRLSSADCPTKEDGMRER